MRRESLNHVAATLVAAGVLTFACTAHVIAAEKYQIYLSPMPFSDATQPNMTGKGTASASLDGDTLSITGTFTGLASAATKAHLSLSDGPGIPGIPLFELTVSPHVAGNVSIQVKLKPDQIAAAKSSKLYVQIDSEKAPTGNLWGWLLAEHEIVGQDVPQKGPWFLPPFAVKRNVVMSTAKKSKQSVVKDGAHISQNPSNEKDQKGKT